ncbi:MAG: phosphoribosyl-ATP diphosphatase [Planctomycetes bacterium]|nr:phosphoribosyl-ATP diphosphatase [Planctomycetota bacterium]MBI3835629.1 phosphoribosyl-ATP diphosphatase [Planctomycetota bacterium]
MIVPSIDLMNGRAVQLVGGRTMELDAGDPRPIAERFALCGEIAVVDLDAALGRGSNADVIHELIRIAPCRVGGGIRSLEAAIRWLDAGACKVMLGTAATPDVLRELSRDRVVAALDCLDGEVVVDGWRTRTGESVLEKLRQLQPLAGGFLVTFVEREGRLGGTRLELVQELVRTAGDAQLTVAGGIASTDEIAELDRLGADAQVGMALYKGRFSLAEAIAAPLTTDRPDGLWPTVVVDEMGVALGWAYSSPRSLKRAVETRRGVYESRLRGIWVKGETSGATQELLHVDLDCDRDTIRFTVRQREPGFCHRNTYTCWGDGDGLFSLARRLQARLTHSPPGSYTRRLLDDSGLLRAKLIEEAAELADATTASEGAAEAADLIYFALTAMTKLGVTFADVDVELARRARMVSRRPGDAKGNSGASA